MRIKISGNLFLITELRNKCGLTISPKVRQKSSVTLSHMPNQILKHLPFLLSQFSHIISPAVGASSSSRHHLTSSHSPTDHFPPLCGLFSHSISPVTPGTRPPGGQRHEQRRSRRQYRPLRRSLPRGRTDSQFPGGAIVPNGRLDRLL